MPDDRASAWPRGAGEMAARIRGHDWASTPLGPIEAWPQSLRTAIDIVLAMPGPVTIIWGPQHVQIYNDAYVAVAGDRHPALLGGALPEGWPEVHETVLAPLLERAYAGRATRLTDVPVFLKGADGSLEERLFDTSWSPIRDASGEIAGALQTLVETTDRFKAQAALRESEARYRLLIGSWAQAVWETDAGGVVVADGPSWRAYTGQTLEEWLGYGWVDAIHPDDRSYVERQWREAIAARGLVDAEFRLRAAGGGWCWTNVRASPVPDASGQITKWAGINIYIDARKRAEANVALLATIADDLTRLVTPGEIIEAAGRRMGEALNLNLGLFADVDEERREVDMHHAWQSQGAPILRQQRFRFGDFLTEEFARSQRAGETFVVRDVVTDERTDAEAYTRLSVGSILAVAFHREGRWVAYRTVTDIGPIDGAVLDINLQGELSYPVADALRRRHVPFVFATGYDSNTVEKAYGDVIVCRKPIRPTVIGQAL